VLSRDETFKRIALESEALSRQMDSIVGLRRDLAPSLEAIGRQVDGSLAALSELGRLPMADAYVAIERIARDWSEQQRRFRSLQLGEAAQLAQQVIGGSEFSRLMPTLQGSSAELSRAMEAMRTPWIDIDDALGSAAAFAELQAMVRAMTESAPFDGTLVDALRGELGDWRWITRMPEHLLSDPLARREFYLETGLNPHLTAFPAPAFHEGLAIAGLREPVIDREVEPDEEEEALARNRLAFDQLQRFEIRIRRFIDAAMAAAFGPNWIKHQVPGEVLNLWREKKATARKAGEPDRPLIEHEDFTDYIRVITRKDNWDKVFDRVFGRREDVQESFQRLYPIRIATMHSRFITLDDELYLEIETHRILRAIGEEPS
jgi:Swt1-like HEPN